MDQSWILDRLQRSLSARTGAAFRTMFSGQTTARLMVDAPSILIDLSAFPEGDAALRCLRAGRRASGA